ncbi:MAG: hypothetical protein QOI60_1156, partial [Actinomycetota bacterium]|nr:hypothetical protein [Actinomycetota bacterium]
MRLQAWKLRVATGALMLGGLAVPAL